MPAEFLSNLPKNLTTHLTHKLYAVFPIVYQKSWRLSINKAEKFRAIRCRMYFNTLHKSTKRAIIKETLHKARLTALHAICLQIFRHIVRKSLAIRKYACGISVQSAEKSDNASYAQALCSVS